MMNKRIALLLCLLLALTLTGCGNSGGNDAADSGTAASDAGGAVEAAAAPTPVPYEPMDWSAVAENTASDFLYEYVSDKYIRIIGYVGTSPVVRVPETIEGMPVKYTGEDAFRENTAITHVYLPDSLTEVGARTFLRCTGLQEVRLPDKSIETIGSSVFNGCEALRQVNIPSTLYEISNSAFSECVLLTEIILPESVHKLGESAFEGCTSLVKLYAPGVYSVGQMALRDCTALADLTLNGECSYIEGNAFNGCTSLGSITLTEVSDEIQYGRLIYENGVLYLTNADNSCMEAVRMFPGTEAGDLVLRNDTTEICHSAFYDCRIKSAVIPASVTKIEGNAFKQCYSLESVTLQEGSALTHVLDNVFESCTALKTVDLSQAAQLRMYDSTFLCADNIEKLILPDNVSISDSLEQMISYSGAKNVTVTYRGADYTYDQIGSIVLSE